MKFVSGGDVKTVLLVTAGVVLAGFLFRFAQKNGIGPLEESSEGFQGI